MSRRPVSGNGLPLWFFHTHKSKRKGENIMRKIKNLLNHFIRDQRGEGFLDVAMKILIVVVIGAAILAIMNAAMPNLFQGLIDKVSGTLTGITIPA
jgi:hypothetical protein